MRLKCVIFGRLKCVIFGRLKGVIFGRLKCAIYGRLKCAIFGRLKYVIFGRLKCIIFGRLKCAFRNNAFRIFENYFKSYNYYYYYSINPTQVRPPFFIFFFFSVRATTLNFFEFYFYDLKRFLANFQGYIASSGQKLFQSVWKQVPKKDQEKPTFVKKWARQKRAYQYANLFVLKSFILSWSKSLKGFKLIAFMALDRFLGDHIWSSPLSCLFLPYTVYTQRPYGIRLNYFFVLFRISKYC